MTPQRKKKADLFEKYDSVLDAVLKVPIEKKSKDLNKPEGKQPPQQGVESNHSN